jgi:Protein of unknown function (DUF3040)
VALSRRERRALREIEEVLASEDPALAVLLRRSGLPRRAWVLRRLTRLVLSVVAALVVLGLVLAHPGMVVSGVLVLMCLPPALWLVAAVLGADE